MYVHVRQLQLLVLQQETLLKDETKQLFWQPVVGSLDVYLKPKAEKPLLDL